MKNDEIIIIRTEIIYIYLINYNTSHIIKVKENTEHIFVKKQSEEDKINIRNIFRKELRNSS